MSKRCYYEVLGVERGADAGSIKTAFRKKAMDCHPDRNPGDETAEKTFKELNEAYDVLKDAQKRAAYDRFGHAAFEGGGGPGGGFGNDFGASFADVFDEFFGEFMGRSGRSRSRGDDVRFDLEITLEEAYAGKSEVIEVPATVACQKCDGSGAEPGTKPQTCPTCSGAGRVRAQQGFFTIERGCPNCAGSGRIVKDPCSGCSGAGRVRNTRSLQVTIPAGVEDGTRIRLAGEGNAGARGGPRGDLYIFLAVKSHPIFEREGAHLFCRVPVTFAAAALGGQIEVPTLGRESAKVTVPEGTQTGRQFRLKGKGMPVLKSPQMGDLFIEVAVETPQKLSKKQRELLEAFAEACDEKTHPQSHGFFARVKDFFEHMGS